MTTKRITMDQVNHHTDMKEELSIDVAIIGAGVSGLYAGYRLLTGERKKDEARPESVHLFDLNDRIGGRLQSIQLPEMDVMGELGAMHYMPEHQITTSLIEGVFNLKQKPFPLGNPDDYIYYLRGNRLRGEDWTIAQKNNKTLQTGYQLHNQDKDYRFDQLIQKTVYELLLADPWFKAKYSHTIQKRSTYEYAFFITNEQWDDIKRNWTYYKPNSPYDRINLHQIGFWNVIKDQIGQEGYAFLADTEGYYSNTINWNAAEAIAYTIGNYSKHIDEYRTIENGYDQIAYALAQAYTSATGSKLWMGHKLQSFKETTDHPRRYKLTFYCEKKEEEWTVYTDKIILAMPTRSLELLEPNVPIINKSRALQKHINSVYSIPSFKLLMGFEYPWWERELGITAGKASTDLPMSQCYYFGSDPSNSHALLLASYNDMYTVHFWNALLGEGGKKAEQPRKTATSESVHHHDGTSQKGVLEKETLLPGEVVPKHMLKEAINQLQEVHGIDIPEPYIARAKDWSTDPYGGGYHNWRAGAKTHETIPFMRHPLPDEAIHIIGDAYSGKQGWIEGAFCVTEHLMQETFNMKWPSWLDKTYYLGY